MEKRQRRNDPMEVERLVFFSDAVVAIAITLLALDLKMDHMNTPMLFSDIAGMWRKFGAFLLSFVLIASFWNVHHTFFRYIRRADEKLMGYNFAWLLFIVILPFCTTLVSERFSEGVPMFVYAANILLLNIFQNNIWDYASVRPELMKEHVDPIVVRHLRVACNVTLVNAALAAAVAYFFPVVAFFILVFRPAVLFLLVGRLRRPKE